MVEVDLHLHTTFSDGRLAPTELVDLCAERGLKVISISDHDTTEGIPETLQAAGAHPDLTVIPGIELSTDVPGGSGSETRRATAPTLGNPQPRGADVERAQARSSDL